MNQNHKARDPRVGAGAPKCESPNLPTADELDELKRLVRAGHYYDVETLEIRENGGLWLRRFFSRCPKSALFLETDDDGQPVLRPALWFLDKWWRVLEMNRPLDGDWIWSGSQEPPEEEPDE